MEILAILIGTSAAMVVGFFLILGGWIWLVGKGETPETHRDLQDVPWVDCAHCDATRQEPPESCAIPGLEEPCCVCRPVKFDPEKGSSHLD